MNHKIKFKTNLPNKNKVRINGHGTYKFSETVKTTRNNPRFFITSSDFAKKHKLLLYPDIVQNGENIITIINLSPFPMDLEKDDHIGTLVSIPSHCKCKENNVNGKV